MQISWPMSMRLHVDTQTYTAPCTTFSQHSHSLSLFHMVKLSHNGRKFITHAGKKCKVSPNKATTYSMEANTLHGTDSVTKLPIWRQVTLEAKKQINLTKQTHCNEPSAAFCCPKPRGIPLLSSLCHQRRGKGKAGNSQGKQHFPQFSGPLRVVCWPAKDHSLLAYNASWLIIMDL